MTIFRYFKESLYDLGVITENQKEAKQIAQSDKYPNFTMDDFSKFKDSLGGDTQLYKYMGWVARNWDALPSDKIGEIIKSFHELEGKKNTGVKKFQSYKNTPNDLVLDVGRANNRKKFIGGKDSESRVDNMWTSKDGTIRVDIPQTKAASVKTGMGSRWCTAANTSPGIDYDAQHMFCKYVLESDGIMVYITNDNLEDYDKFYKSAIRLERQGSSPVIMEIRGLDNTTNFKGDLGYGWNKEYDMYLKEWDIPLEELFGNISIKIDDLQGERETHKMETEFIKCVKSNDIECLDKIVDDGYIPHASALNVAVLKSDADMIKYLSQYDTVKPDDNTLVYAFKSNDNDTIENAIKWGSSWKNIALDELNSLSTISGPIIKAALDHDIEPNTDTVYKVMHGGDYDAVKALVDAGVRLYPSLANIIAANSNSKDSAAIVKLILDNSDTAYSKFDKDLKSILSSAMLHNNTEVVDLLADEYGITVDISHLRSAVESKNVDMVKTILDGVDEGDDPININRHAVSDAATQHNDILAMLLDAGASVNDNTLAYALKFGPIENIKLLMDTDIPINGRTLDYAIQREMDDVDEVLDMVLKVRPKVNIGVLNSAAGNLSVGPFKRLLDVAEANGVEPGIQTLNNAAENDADVFKLVMDSGVEPDDTTWKYARDSAEIMKLILDAGVDPNSQTINNAIKTGDVGLTKRILKKVRPNSGSMYDAVSSKNLDMVKLIADATDTDLSSFRVPTDATDEIRDYITSTQTKS